MFFPFHKILKQQAQKLKDVLANLFYHIQKQALQGYRLQQTGIFQSRIRFHKYNLNLWGVRHGSYKYWVYNHKRNIKRTRPPVRHV